MQKWEYTSINASIQKHQWSFTYGGQQYSGADRDQLMNKMGQEGWELVVAFPFEDMKDGVYTPTRTVGYTLFFKRPIP